MGLFTAKQISTQEHLDIEDIKDDLVVLKTGSVALVIGTNALNFELLSNEEQDANIYSFANLLNSISFPIQIVIRTVSTDVSKYIDQLETYKQQVMNSPLADQVVIYQNFISNLTEKTNILDKSFYLVIPTKAFEAIRTSAVRQIFGQSQKLINVDQIIERAKGELIPKRDSMFKSFASMGLDSWQLKNDELIKLYYGIYEPDKTGGSKLGISSSDINSAMITSNEFQKDNSANIKQSL
jgi:hypothetical protein